MTQKRSFLRAAAILLALLLLSVFAPAAAETAEAPQQTVFVFDQDREMDLWQQDKTLRVFCIPVGAQDCYFITCEGHAMVLDCAGVGREPTPDFLFRLCDALGIDRLDFAFNTHPHRDHINGFTELLAKIPADEYLSTFPLDSDKYQRQLIHQLRELNIPIRVCEAGEALSLGGAQLETYRYMGTKNTNDRSMVVHIRYGERSILFTADIGLTAQRDLARENAGQFKSDILIHDFTQTPAADGQMIAQRNFGDMVSEQDLQLVQCTERRHVGTENSQKIQQDISHNPGERQPAIIHDHSHIQLVKVRKNTDN